MGLDMYACTMSEAPAREVDFEDEGAVQIHYWRKHPNLHGWMERLYHDKGGAQELFNCANVQLTSADLANLETAIRAGVLPETTGFFFGASDGTEAADDLAFLAKAREALAAGKIVFYSSWW